MTFSLAGADAAISRMQALCSAAAETARTP